MSFPYLICLDFEATCWSGYFDKTNSEIIEFGAVLLNTDTGEIENQFHHYVRPTLFPKLSSFCINLTGIKQFMVNDQDPFPGVLKKFHNWIKKMQNEKGLRFATSTEKHVTVDGPNVTFCSWSDFDLDFFFKQDCRRADIDVLPYFKAWVDGRQIFNRKYYRGRCRFVDALRLAKICSVGHAHSAINDATNLAKLMTHLIESGVQCNRITSSYL